MTNLRHLMKQAANMQQNMVRVQEQLAQQTVEFSSGGGMVTATASGDGSLRAIRIDPRVIDPAEKEMLEDMVLAAVDGALKKSRELMAREMAAVTGGLNLPGMLG